MAHSWIIVVHFLIPVVVLTLLTQLTPRQPPLRSTSSEMSVSASEPLPPILPPDITQSVTRFQSRLQIVCAGDSLTQRGSEPDGWVTLLAHYYSRKADILNRGYSGYNSNHFLAMLKTHIQVGCWPTPTASTPTSHGNSANEQQTLLTLCLGANDSCLKEGYSSAQSVSVQDYTANMRSILTLLKGADGKSTPNLHVIIISPPQHDAKTWSLVSQQRHKLEAAPLTRNNEYTKLFVDAALSVASEFQVPFIDMYALTSDWSKLLIDGLHFTELGNRLLLQEVLETIKKNYPLLCASKLSVDSFPFLEIKGVNLEETEQFYSHHAKHHDRSSL